MKGAVLDLAGLSHNRLFEEIADGIPLIVANAENLEKVARGLYEACEHQASEIIRGFAEEEAAKVLILLDAVRCPTSSRSAVLKCFYKHLPKRIYALTCSFPKIWSFGELAGLVARERQPYYLDGPNDVDWIFTNSITTERERTIYVDYVRDITGTSGDRLWSAPDEHGSHFGSYRISDAVELARALCDAGATSIEGLAVVADAWRGFVPAEDTSRDELRERIAGTLTKLVKQGRSGLEESSVGWILSRWSFPLWPFCLNDSSRSKTLEELREERRLTIAWIERTQARRDPPPAIPRAKVEAMSAAFAAWRDECNEDDARRGYAKDGKIRFRSSSEFAKHLELFSYKALAEMFGELEAGEKAALLALAWFTRDSVADWPRVYERAKESSPTLDPGYQIGNGADWLTGLQRWEENPKPFSAGRWYSADRVRKQKR